MFAFILGREFRISLAEVENLFPEAIFEYVNEQFALVSEVSEEVVRNTFPHMGGTIKVIKILEEIKDVPDFMTSAKNYLERVDRTNKVTFAIAAYGEKLDNFSTGLRVKKFLKTCEDKSFRLVNKEPKNINSAVYKKERLSESETELNFIKAGKIAYFGVTIAYQDVDEYAARDMDKTRDMGVGMLPPKLAQMMINLAGSVEKCDLLVQNSVLRSPYASTVHSDTRFSQESHHFWSQSSENSGRQNSIYDPFCGLGTILIEAANMGYSHIFGSDISKEMVQASKKSMENFRVKIVGSSEISQKRSNLNEKWAPEWGVRDSTTNEEAEFWVQRTSFSEVSIFEADASKIAATIPEDMNTQTTVIVTEGYLGDVLNTRTITMDKISEQCRKLARIYDGMFRDLRTVGFRGTIIISFPFWDNRGKDVFFEDILPIIDRYGFERLPLLDDKAPFRTTPHKSLLYRRPGQTVGREIYKLQLLPKEKLGLRL